MKREESTSTFRSDAKVISEFMEPSTGPREHWWALDTPNGDWLPILWVCPSLERLGRIYLVEELLTEDQRRAYWLELGKGGRPVGYWRIAHASAAEKMRALAMVIREQKSSGSITQC